MPGRGHSHFSATENKALTHPSPHSCVVGQNNLHLHSRSAFSREEAEDFQGVWILRIAFAENTRAKWAVLLQGGCWRGGGVGIFSPRFTRHT